MAFDSVPWFVGKGAQHDETVMRTLSYMAMGGGTGILDAGDCKVTQTGAASSQVLIDKGIVGIKSKSGSAQGYIGRNQQGQLTVPITPTTSAGARSDLVIVRIEDPNITGATWQPPADATKGPYIFPRVLSNVPNTTTSVEQLNLGYDAITLARIDIPPSTAAITQAMIVDLRRMANPREHQEQFTFGTGLASYALVTDTYGLFPVYEAGFTVPSWATVCRGTYLATGLFKPPGGTVIGDIRMELGLTGQAGTPLGNTVFRHDDNTIGTRVTVAAGGSAPCVDSQGLARVIRMGARRSSAGSAANGTLITDAYTLHQINLTLLETPV